MKQQIFDIALQFLGSAVVAFFTLLATGLLTLSPLELSFFQRMLLSGVVFGLMFGTFVGKPHAGFISLAILLLLLITSWQRAIPCIIWPTRFGDFVCSDVHTTFWAIIAASITSFLVGLIRKYRSPFPRKNTAQTKG